MKVHLRVIVIVCALASLGVGGPRAAAAPGSADYSSFFWQRELAGAGWAACPDPLTWSADTRGLTSRQGRREVRRLDQAWEAWSDATGVRVEFIGRERLEFDPGTNGLRRPDGAPPPDRHVYVAFKTSRQAPLITRGVVGYAMPSVVLVPTREIVGGVAVFRLGYVLEQRKVTPERVLHLYLHEVGHVLGLGHADGVGNVMYPSLDHLVQLGTGDRAGARSFTQPCLRVTAGVTDGSSG